MKKKYELPEENHESEIGHSQTNMVNEPAMEYSLEAEMTYSPPLTEEELKECITGDELMEAVFAHIDELFDKKK